MYKYNFHDQKASKYGAFGIWIVTLRVEWPRTSILSSMKKFSELFTQVGIEWVLIEIFRGVKLG